MSNTTFLPDTVPTSYWSHYQSLSTHSPQLNLAETLWASWYAYMQNDVLATGIMAFVFHEIVYFGRCLPWIIIDLLPQYFGKWKIQNAKVATAAAQWRCTKLILLSHFTIELPQIWMFHPMAKYFGLSVDVPFPGLLKIAYQLVIFFVLEDAWHYWFHRLFHYGPFYKYIHKIHHEYSAPFGLAAEYASPIEVVMLGIGTVGSPILYCAITKDLHLITMYIWICLRLFQAIDSHSGYDFPWSLHHFLPFWAGAAHHDVHHEKFIGNYSSSFTWWDWMLDTEAGEAASQKRRDKKRAEKDARVIAEQEVIAKRSLDGEGMFAGMSGETSKKTI